MVEQIDFRVGATVEKALKALFSRFGTYMGLGLLIYLPIFLLILSIGDADGPDEEDLALGEAVAAILFLSIPHALVSAACTFGIHAEARGERQTIISLASRAARVFIPYYMATIMATLAALFGLVLLIIPGLFAIALLTFMGPAIAIEGSGFFGGIDRTLELTRGSLFRLFLLALIYVMFAAAIVSPQEFTSEAGNLISSLGGYLPYAALSVFGGLLGGSAHIEMLRARSAQSSITALD